MDSFTDLEAWKAGMELLKEVYVLTDTFPREDRYELVSQIRRASTSILANLAEGFSRSTAPDKAHKYTIARGECSEVTALLLMSIELKRISKDRSQNCLNLAQRTGQLLSGLIRTFTSRRDPNPNPTPNPSPAFSHNENIPS